MIRPKKAPRYLMEHPEESERLKTKSNREATLLQLRMTGLADVPQGGLAVDAGSGVGFVANLMCEELEGRDATVKLLDQSELRLSEAKKYLKRVSGVASEFEACDLDTIPMEDGQADYVFCRFVFEYLSDQMRVFDELVRITKPGGKVVIGDLDNNCLIHYPIASDLEQKLHKIADALAKTKYLDPYAGRRLFSYFHGCADLTNVKVHMLPHHLFYGQMEDAQLSNWERKLDQLILKNKSGELNFDFDLVAFKKEFMKFVESESRFSYTPLILVEGKKK